MSNVSLQLSKEEAGCNSGLALISELQCHVRSYRAIKHNQGPLGIIVLGPNITLSEKVLVPSVSVQTPHKRVCWLWQ